MIIVIALLLRILSFVLIPVIAMAIVINIIYNLIPIVAVIGISIIYNLIPITVLLYGAHVGCRKVCDYLVSGTYNFDTNRVFQILTSKIDR
jgi:hypothetical protein